MNTLTRNIELFSLEYLSLFQSKNSFLLISIILHYNL